MLGDPCSHAIEPQDTLAGRSILHEISLVNARASSARGAATLEVPGHALLVHGIRVKAMASVIKSRNPPINPAGLSLQLS